MERTPDKPPGTEQHPPGENPERQGPGAPTEQAPPDAERPQTGEPPPEASPGEPGVTNPKRGKIGRPPG
jgi:hypothetical protein